MTIKDFSVGQIAYYYSGRDWKREEIPLQEVTVTKIGRKYVTVKYGWWERRFAPTGGGWDDRYLVEKVEIGTPGLLYKSREAYEEQRELESLRSWLRKAADWGTVNRYTLEQLREIKTILER